MTTLQKWPFLTATSLTARQINRRVILNTIHKHQPLSRADTARITGLQRSTVSLIVEELKDDAWIIEKEYGRIPRGRRPIYLTMNPNARFLGLAITDHNVSCALSDLNGTVVWTGSQPLPDKSPAALRTALEALRTKVDTQLVTIVDDKPAQFLLKGIGVTLDTATNYQQVDHMTQELFGACAVVDSVAVACGELFLLTSKDAELAQGHLVSMHAGSTLETRVILDRLPMRGANGRAGFASSNGHHAGEITADHIADRLNFVFEAYDPGIVIVSGNIQGGPENLRTALDSHLKKMGRNTDIVRILPEAEEENLFVRASIALIMNHFLTECDI